MTKRKRRWPIRRQGAAGEARHRAAGDDPAGIPEIFEADVRDTEALAKAAGIEKQ